MHKYYSEMSIARRNKMNLGSNLLKNQRKIKLHKAALYPHSDSRKPETISKKQLDSYVPLLKTPKPSKEPTNLFSATTRSSLKIDNLFSKILDSPNKSEISTKNLNRFRKSISTSLNYFKTPSVLSEKEQKDLIDDYSKTAKPNMYSISKPGVKYRKTNLEKKLQKHHKI